MGKGTKRTYQPKKRHRNKKVGFLHKNPKVISRRRAKKRARLAL